MRQARDFRNYLFILIKFIYDCSKNLMIKIRCYQSYNSIYIFIFKNVAFFCNLTIERLKFSYCLTADKILVLQTYRSPHFLNEIKLSIN